MITVEQAERIIQSQTRNYGMEEVVYSTALRRVLAEDIFADRDLPPFNRATVDGIAISYAAYNNGLRSFKKQYIQPAGTPPVGIASPDECIEIMTGAALDVTVDTVIRYEDISIKDGVATLVCPDIKKGQNIHEQGKDKKQGERVAEANTIITPAMMGLIASIGKVKLLVKKLPRLLIITTGDEMVEVGTMPTAQQLRRSNDITLKSALVPYGVQVDTLHLNDDYDKIRNELDRCLAEYDAILMTGGVSMGTFDFVPRALADLNVRQLFHKVSQRPGKPFWFGAKDDQVLVFAFPGNAVSAFMCLYRYFIPWLERCLGISSSPATFAVLERDIHFPYPLQYFAQVKLSSDQHGQCLAAPVDTNGSGDFTQLIHADAFMEFPMEKNEFKKGEVYRTWKYNF